MKESIRVKKAFTLIEVVLVVLLVSILYFLTFSSFSTSIEKKEYKKVDLENIKEFMLKNFEYENELTISCIEEEKLNCYIFIDEKKSKDIKIENLFRIIPEVYHYDRNMDRYEFEKVKIEDSEYEPFFELKLNRDKKHKDLILDTLDLNVYLFNSISTKVEKFETINEIKDRFLELELEVKNAF